MNRTAPDEPTTTVSALSDQRLQERLKELTAVEHQIEIVVIDHLRELHRRRLYLTLGCSSLFDYATRELGYSEAAAWRRIKAMRLCGEVEGARERMQDGSLTLNSAALLQNAFDRQERKVRRPAWRAGLRPAGRGARRIGAGCRRSVTRAQRTGANQGAAGGASARLVGAASAGGAGGRQEHAAGTETAGRGGSGADGAGGPDGRWTRGGGSSRP